MADDAASVVFDELSREECEQLLASHRVGRLGLVVDDQPHILPVNYATPGGAEVVFRTAAGTVLNEASLRRVAFEVDEIDADSVALRKLPLVTWLPGERHQWFKIVPAAVTGRRISRA